jgi:Replication initiator protein, pSAM2
MTGTAAALAPAPEHPLASGSGAGASPTRLLIDTNAQVTARASNPDYDQWIQQVESVGDCTRPVLLARTALIADRGTGEVLHARHDNDGLPDGVVYKRCGTRLASVCPSCSEIYRHDAYHLIRAGIAGGKGVPDMVAAHPAVFVTATAPSFGPVHARRVTSDGRVLPCRPRRKSGRRDPHCPHGVLIACPRRHREDDLLLGRPVCVRCFDYDHAVVWNAYVSELWRRTSIELRRGLNRISRMQADGVEVKPNYGKTGEYQHRGLIHYHALVRLDGYHRDRSDDYPAPPAELTAEHLIAAIEHAFTVTAFRTPPHPGNTDGWVIQWGSQLEVRTISEGLGTGQIDGSKVASYLAKYATKSTEAVGGVTVRITADNVDIHASQRTHLGRLIRAAWHLGHVPDTPEHRRYRALRRWAHRLGHGGHFTTKSRAYSITFRAIRQARRDHARAQAARSCIRLVDRAERHEREATTVVHVYSYVGQGWLSNGDAVLAMTAATLAREKRRTAREELACA